MERLRVCKRGSESGDVLPGERGFNLGVPSRNWSTLHLNHSPHLERRMFEVVFSSNDDEFIADAGAVRVVSA